MKVNFAMTWCLEKTTQTELRKEKAEYLYIVGYHVVM